MLEVYGFSRVNEFARGNTRDLRVLWALARCMDRPAWKRTLDAYCARVEPG
jgi:hypothetical protein